VDTEKFFKEILPTLKNPKDPTTALLVGLVFGGIGLAVYFRKVIDFFIPIGIVIALEILHTQLQGQGLIYIAAGALIAAAYGYLRAKYSNEMLAQAPGNGAISSSPSIVQSCTHCGYTLEPAATFCPHCGTRRAGATSFS